MKRSFYAVSEYVYMIQDQTGICIRYAFVTRQAVRLHGTLLSVALIHFGPAKLETVAEALFWKEMSLSFPRKETCHIETNFASWKQQSVFQSSQKLCFFTFVPAT